MSAEIPEPTSSAVRRLPLLNIWVHDLGMSELVDALCAHGGVVHTLNLDHLYLLQRLRPFYEAYRAADFVTADSSYVCLALRLLGRPVREKCTGSDLVPRFCDRAAEFPGMRVFFLGAAPGVAQRARERTNARVGREVVVGALSPSMGFVDDADETAAAIRAINDCGATALIVGLGAPKQEVWIHRHRAAMPGVRTFMGVGATLDYEAGHVQRAPAWTGRLGLEWLHRVVTQPRRYATRYLRDLEFFRHLAADLLRRYRDPHADGESPPAAARRTSRFPEP